MGYETYRIADLIDEIAMGPFGSNIKVSCFVDSGVPVLNGSNLEGFSLSEKTFRYVTRKKADSLNKANAHRGDIVITHRGTLGQIVFIPQDSKYDRYVISQSQFRVRCNDKVLPEYLVYYFHTPIGQHKLLSNASQVGVPALARPSSTFQQIEVVLPELSIQKCVVEIISTIQKKIANNQELNDNLYEMVNAYYTSLFKDVECEMTTIGNYAERIYSGGTPTTSNAAYWGGAFGWFSSGETRNRFVISTEKSITQTGIDNSSTKLAAKHDIVMASAGQGFTRGQTSMLLIDTYVNQSVIVIHADRKILPYLFWNLANRYEELRAISDSSSIRGSLTTKMIAAFEVPLANNDVIQTFSDFAWAVIPQIENNLLENERLAALRDLLLPKLMSGEIDVSAVQL